MIFVARVENTDINFSRNAVSRLTCISVAVKTVEQQSVLMMQ